METFAAMHTKFYNSLIGNKTKFEKLSALIDEGDLKTVLQYIWGLEEFHSNLKVDLIYSKKNDDNADKLRHSANILYKNKKSENALKYYNESIISAFNPRPNKPGNSSVSLSFGYGNRSAVFYDLKLFNLCLADIKRSLKQNYPFDLHEKLIVREIKCHLAMHNLAAAKETYSRCFPRYVDSPELIARGKMCIQEYEKKFPRGKESEIESTKFSYFNVPLINNPHKVFPAVRDALEINYSNKGRGFIANRDILPGEVILQEKAFAAVLKPKYRLTHCSYCLQNVNRAPVPCTTCLNVVFCNERCRDEALHAFHMEECSMLSAFTSMNMTKPAVIAFRILCQLNMPNLMKQFSLYEKEILTEDPKVIRLKDGIYCSNDIQNIFRLVKHQEWRSSCEITSACVMALTIFKLFCKKRPHSKQYETNLQFLLTNQLTLATMLAKLIISGFCNIHSITESTELDIWRSKPVNTIGCGIFLAFSLFNHSCDPNMAATNFGHGMMAIASQFIKSGSEILISYGPRFSRDSLNRKEELQNMYNFICDCHACVEKWPLYKDLPVNMTLRCTNCNGDFRLDICEKCEKPADQLKAYDSEGSEIDFNKVFSNKLIMLNTFFMLQVKFVSKGIEYDTNDIVDVIDFCNKYCVLPARIFLDAQEFLYKKFSKSNYSELY